MKLALTSSDFNRPRAYIFAMFSNKLFSFVTFLNTPFNFESANS
jgi:hypothetical protein